MVIKFNLKKNVILMIILCMFLFLSFAISGQAKTYNLKIATDQTITGTATYGWEVFKNYVEDSSNGQIQVDVYPNSQLGEGDEVLEKLKTGILKISQGDESIASAYPPLMVLQIPYLWDNIEMVSEFVDTSPFWDELNDGLEEKMGLRILGLNPYGLYCFLNNKRPIKTLEDLKGLKIRVKLGCPHIMKALNGLGASGTPCDWGEVYTSMKTGVINGIPHAINLIQDQKFYEVAKYLTLDHNFLGYNLCLVNAKWWNSLPEDIKAIIQQGARMDSAVERGLSIFRNRITGLKALKKAGVEVTVLSQSERERFKKAAQGPTIEWMSKEVGKYYVDKMFEAVEKIEKERGFK